MRMGGIVLDSGCSEECIAFKMMFFLETLFLVISKIDPIFSYSLQR